MDKIDEILSTQSQTLEHISNVQRLMGLIIKIMMSKSFGHDISKLKNPEVETFAEYTPKLAGTTYGSDEYNGYLSEMKVALDHHYSTNKHHPEHFGNGINDMTLIDIIEMLCDWKAATMRHNDGDIYKSIEINAKRFSIDEQVVKILINTVKLFECGDE